MLPLTSNAYNFSEFIQSGVDPRTGSFSLSLGLGQFLSYYTSGPNVALNLHYNPAMDVDMGFGRGWFLSLSSFDQKELKLSLSSGQSFKIEWNDVKNEYDLPYRRLKDIRVTYRDEDNTLVVCHKDGHREILDYQTGYLKQIQSPQGLAVFFEYSLQVNIWRLWRIYDHAGKETEIDWYSSDNQVEVIHRFNSREKQRFTLEKTLHAHGYRLQEFFIPGITTPLSIDYHYEENCQHDLIEAVYHPSGLKELIHYELEGHRLPDGAPLDYLPRVSTHTLIAGESQPDRLAEYHYSASNYLGFGVNLAWQPNEDTLFQAEKDYRYSVTETLDARQTIFREYNKYHLLETAEYSNEGQRYKREQYEYFADLTQGIESQPAIYSLLKKKSTTHYVQQETRIFSQSYLYDDYANPLYECYSDGSKMLWQYYEAQGEDGCPAHPFGMVSLLKTETFLPAPQFQDPPRATEFTYTQLPRLDDATQYHVLALAQTNRFKTYHYAYWEDVNNVFSYGRIKQETTEYNGHSTSSIMRYEVLPEGLETTILFTGHDGLRVLRADVTEGYWGKRIEYTNSYGIKTHIQYDELGRTTRVVSAPGTEFEVWQNVRYHISPQDCYIHQSDIKGNQKLTRYNGAGQPVEVKKASPEVTWQTIYTCQYDALGLNISETDIDVLDGQVLSLTTEYTYDVYGSVSHIYHPDGRIERVEQNPVSLTSTHVQEGLLTQTTTYTLSGLQQSQSSVGADGEQLAYTEYHYDGYGNVIRTIDTEGRIINTRYDALDREIEIERHIDQSPVIEQRTYPAFSTDSLPNQVLVNGVLLGEREFDGLLRLTEARRSQIHHQLKYKESSLLPHQIITPHGDTVNLMNNLYIEKPEWLSVTGDPSLTTSYCYDPQNGQICCSRNQSAECENEYDSEGRITRERVVLNDGVLRESQHRYSLQGKILTSVDYFGHQTLYSYDRLARLSTLIEDVDGIRSETSIAYDVFSRPYLYTTQRGQDTAEIELSFNSLGMEMSRVARFNQERQFSIEQSFNTRLLLELRCFQDNLGETSENYTYDDLGRLTHYTCQGPNCPQDQYGNTLISQEFTHDIFGNITTVKSHFLEDEVNITTFEYLPDNPQRLKRLSNTHASYPAQVVFNYDAAGNLLNDESGLQLNYNALNQMVSVSKDGNTLSQYCYDGLGRQVSQTVEGALVYLFYLNEQLSHEACDGLHATYHTSGPGLSERSVSGESAEHQHQFLFGNSQGSVLTTQTALDEGSKWQSTTRQYTPYGEG
ncbi:RHS repeat protein [Vibrio navarrensis]